LDRLGDVSARRALLLLGALIVVGGFALALLSNPTFGTLGPSSPYSGPGSVPVDQRVGGSYPTSPAVYSNGVGVPSNSTLVVGPTVYSVTTTYRGTSPQGTTGQTGSNLSQGSPAGAGGLIEFSSQVNLRSSNPQQTASGIVALAYSVGGYVAFQSTDPTSADVVIRVPAGQYQQVLAKVQGLGTVLSLVSNSNDVRVQYTDLNATLESLRTEQAALLRLLNQSSTVNSTLAIESQLQGVDQQVNDIESQILQTRTLIDYATVDVTVSQTAQQAPLSLTLSATPKNGSAPLSVTFNAVARGGDQPYVVNYNFGDGDAAQGQIVIHTYYQPGDYSVTATVTDLNGTVALASATVHVGAARAQLGVSNFLGTVAGLFVSVVEGVVEVAVVVLPLAAVGAAVVIPVRRRNRNQKGLKQGQQA
jgi:Domain of unknown function (DUF4349)/PKD domain